MTHLLRGAIVPALVAALAVAQVLSMSMPDTSSMVTVPAGSYRPLYRLPTGVVDRRDTPRREVHAFAMDVHPVTNGEFLAFVRDHPEWRRSQAKKLFVDRAYLSHWRGDLDPGPLAPLDSPVVYVSWFAARAYLKAQGKDLPTVDQWEYVAAADETVRDASRDPAFLARLRSWYGRTLPQPVPPAGSGLRNLYGIADLHGLVWEWTLDFNSALVTGESRGDGSIDAGLYCGSGAAAAADFDNYPAFMRFAFRSSLEARYSVGSLGFRGVRNLSGAGQ
ncbi:MAG: formylglycine-generating enzyme family protein [Acidobacteriota bacterium]|jgi:sulfatase modifying factor 1